MASRRYQWASYNNQRRLEVWDDLFTAARMLTHNTRGVNPLTDFSYYHWKRAFKIALWWAREMFGVKGAGCILRRAKECCLTA